VTVKGYLKSDKLHTALSLMLILSQLYSQPSVW